MRQVLAAIIVAALAVISAPAAGALPVAYVGPTYFSDAGQGGPNWSVAATGSTMPVAQADYGADPDVSVSASFAFSDANDAAGTVSPGLAYWPRGHTASPVQQNSRAVMGTSPAFMLAIQRRYVSDDFVVFVLDFAGDDLLTGDYYTCGPAAFQANPQTIGSDGGPGFYDGPFYAEGAIAAKRGNVAPALPAAPDELYGLFGSIGGESPYCDEARQASALWNSQPAPPNASNDNRRTTRTEVACNRGPNPGDPFTCTATVADSDQQLGASAPTGPAGLTATSGTPSARSCSLSASPSSPATATCTFTYVNAAIGAGSQVPVTVSYHGDGTHKPSSASPTQVVPDNTTPDTSGGSPVVCGAAPLPACAGLIPGAGPVQTCVGNTGGSCININQQFAPIKVCIASVTAACQGFTGGALFAGLIKQPSSVTMTLFCPDVDILSATPDYEACRSTITMTTDQQAIVKSFDRLFKEEFRLRYAVWQAVNARGPEVKQHLGRHTVADVAKPSLERSLITHNEQALAANALIDALSSKERTQLGVGHLDHLNLDAHLDRFPAFAEGPDGNYYYDPRILGLKVYTDLRAVTAAKGKRIRGYTRTAAVTGSATIARSRTVTLKPGAHIKVKVSFTKLGRVLLTRARRGGRARLRVGATVRMTSTSGRFAPTTISRRFSARIAKPTPLHKR